MSEWFFERGIGEDRAALVEDGAILAAAIALPTDHRAGEIAEARLVRIETGGRAGLVVLDDATELLVQPLPRGATEGARLTVEIIREALPPKRALCRVADAKALPRPGPDLPERLATDGRTVRVIEPHGPDALEAAGWSELLEEAVTGNIPFPGGTLLMTLAPAMTLFDVDGTLAPAELAVAGAAAVGRTVRRLDLGGSIGVDFPTLGAKSERAATAAALDAVLPPPFERTAVNGFGFMQVILPKVRASLPELIGKDRAGAATRALLRRAEKTPGYGPIMLTGAAAVMARLEASPEWTGALSARLGASVGLKVDPVATIWAGHAERAFP